MTAAIIAVGNELLSGLSIETNSHFLINKLKIAGISTSSVSIVGDDPDSIVRALNTEVANDVDVVLVTGGLGPTHDDVTMKTAADYFGSEIIHSEEAYKRIQKLFSDRGIASLSKINRDQALVPEKAELIPNLNGTAQGLKFSKENRKYFFMPGVPVEMEKMFDDFILPELQKQSRQSITNIIIHTTGVPESVLFQKIEHWINKNQELSISILPRFPEVDISVTKTSDIRYGKSDVESAVSELSELLGDDIFGYDDDTLESVIAQQLVMHRLTIATAESCTGGLIANRLTDISGSSEYFKQGIICYSNQSKIEQLGVSEKTLLAHGAVSREAALEMARNVRQIAKADIGLSTTGIAGPTGGSPEKPLGTVYIGLSMNGRDDIFHFQYNRDRLSNKFFFSQMALNQLRLTLKGIDG
ncbi:competence/damage-inducible protein A [bacterium]|nr:competence/damage-inducible protein A [bacterium]MBU1065243.1 competence/damage-inducible protein A [bacterium]MBU1635495.1 competence/damage-inducible protein A [bacterium]MBU1873784.1 competence/damage-inducible protein A [bacterium]